MNKEKMLKWAEALESGEYKQCRNSWGKGNGLLAVILPATGAAKKGFCCLHVALEIEKEEYLKVKEVFPLTTDIVCEIYGLDSVGQFIEWNDVDLLSFPEIAEKIREMVEGEEA